MNEADAADAVILGGLIIIIIIRWTTVSGPGIRAAVIWTAISWIGAVWTVVRSDVRTRLGRLLAHRRTTVFVFVGLLVGTRAESWRIRGLSGTLILHGALVVIILALIVHGTLVGRLVLHLVLNRRLLLVLEVGRGSGILGKIGILSAGRAGDDE